MNNYTLLLFPGFKDKALTLSYDDGVVYDKRLVEILDENGIKCTFNINSGLFACDEGERRLTEKAALELYKNGNHEIAIHGRRHLPMAEVSEESAVYDIIEDRKNLERLFGRIVKGMAYANGSFNDNAVEILKLCGVKYARTTKSTGGFAIPSDWLRLKPTCHHNDTKLMSLADEFLAPVDQWYFWSIKPKLFYLWGHSYEFNDNNNWQIIEDFARKTGNRPDVWYATNGEVFDYVKAFDSLEFSVDNKIISNHSSIDVFINLYGEKVLISAGETVNV